MNASTSKPRSRRSTRDRLLSAGMSMIAERGFKDVTVGDIEAAAGLVPRRGALYKHFASKQELIEAAIEERINDVADLSELVDWLVSDEAAADPRGSMLLVGRAVLGELDQEKHVNQIIEKEGARFPDLRDRMLREMVEPGFRYTERVLQAWIERFGSDSPDHPTDAAALAAVLLSSLVHHRRQEWLLGVPPHGISTDRFLDAWVDTVLAALNVPDHNNENHNESGKKQ